MNQPELQQVEIKPELTNDEKLKKLSEIIQHFPKLHPPSIVPKKQK